MIPQEALVLVVATLLATVVFVEESKGALGPLAGALLLALAMLAALVVFLRPLVRLSN
jgi:hypothetical protein